MKKNFYAVLSILFLLSFCTLQAIAQSADEVKVRAVIQKAEDAWNAHDYSYAGKYDIYTTDAVLVNPVGMYWKNKSQILSGIKQFGSMMFQYESTKYNIKNIHFLAPAVALVIVHSVDKVEQDFNLPNGKKGGTKGDINEAMYTYTPVKKDENWKIASLQVTRVDAIAAISNPFKDN